MRALFYISLITLITYSIHADNLDDDKACNKYKKAIVSFIYKECPGVKISRNKVLKFKEEGNTKFLLFETGIGDDSITFYGKAWYKFTVKKGGNISETVQLKSVDNSPLPFDITERETFIKETLKNPDSLRTSSLFTCATSIAYYSPTLYTTAEANLISIDDQEQTNNSLEYISKFPKKSNEQLVINCLVKTVNRLNNNYDPDKDC